MNIYKSASILVLFCSAAFGAEIGLTVVTPSRTARPIGEIPGAVEVISGAQLESAPGAALDEKLAGLIPGAVGNRANGIYSFASVVALRGLPASEQGRTLVLLDGAPVNTGATGAVNWNRLAAEGIAQIEVFKGPASSLYGSNAAAGVINLITRKAAPGYRLGAAYGGYNTIQAGAGAGAKIRNLTLSMDGGYLSSGGYNSTPEDQRTAPDYTVDKYARDKYASAKASLGLGENGAVDLQYSRGEGLRGEGVRIRTAEGASRRYVTDFARAAWHGEKGGTAWQTQAYYQLEDYSRLNESSKNGYTRVNTDARREDAGGQAAVSLPLAGLTATLGADYKLGSVDATDHNVAPAPAYDSKDRGRISQYAPYAQAEKKMFSERLKLLAALRYDNARYFDGFFYNPSNTVNLVNGPQSAHYWDRFSPKLAASWSYSGRAEQYVSYGRGFRPPALEDLCLTLLRGSGTSKRLNIANPALKPETVDTAETGFRLSPLTGLYADPAVYYTIGRNFMYTTDTGDVAGGVKVSKKENIARVRVYGAELPVKFYSGAFSLAAAYAWSDSEIRKYAGPAALEGKTLAYAPRGTASASVGLKTAPAAFTLLWTYKSGQYITDDNSARVGGYYTVSASARRSFTRALSAGLSVENIFNRRYQESGADLAPGRTVTISLEAEF
ncbi:MAG: TonB-dependent receptor [Elusimicrobiales bacterium]|jgi:outer membrane receptor protein involved in Fe transport